VLVSPTIFREGPFRKLIEHHEEEIRDAWNRHFGR
jgi:hypothetical protein